ncbi:DUF6879 family protein [Streptomyces avicenniae]|uniref:DUF6879 family protein n=1 Tax=Streptomyces avicenniae TaxID=500153 RepID=UPI0006995A1D|nr:DUF6879 family protein [Streptomyces avicenniae]
MGSSDGGPPPTLDELFDSFTREAFRLETLDDYSGSGSTDAYAAFLEGREKPEGYNEDWMSEIRESVRQGKRIHRVHVLSRPLTPYLRFELGWGYRTNMTAGEEFHILDVTDRPDPLEGVGDFWLFDQRIAASMEYREGVMTGCTVLADDEVRDFLNWRDIALSGAVPFSEWWTEHGREDGRTRRRTAGPARDVG